MTSWILHSFSLQITINQLIQCTPPSPASTCTLPQLISAVIFSMKYISWVESRPIHVILFCRLISFCLRFLWSERSPMCHLTLCCPRVACNCGTSSTTSAIRISEVFAVCKLQGNVTWSTFWQFLQYFYICRCRCPLWGWFPFHLSILYLYPEVLFYFIVEDANKPVCLTGWSVLSTGKVNVDGAEEKEQVDPGGPWQQSDCCQKGAEFLVSQ